MKAAFATDIILPFDNLRDVLKAFPSWNLVYMHGNSAYFEVLASQVHNTQLSKRIRGYLSLPALNRKSTYFQFSFLTIIRNIRGKL